MSHPTVISAAAAEGNREGGNRGEGSGKGRRRSSTNAEASRSQGVSLSTSWPFSFVRAAFGASYQQVIEGGLESMVYGVWCMG